MGARIYHLRVPAEARCLRAVRAFVTVALADCSCRTTERIVLALDEACANVIKHRNPGMGCTDVAISIEIDPDVFRCRIGSFCHRDDVANIRPRPIDDVRPGGLGTHFIQQVMDSVRYEPDPERPGAMLLVLEKRLPEEAK